MHFFFNTSIRTNTSHHVNVFQAKLLIGLRQRIDHLLLLKITFDEEHKDGERIDDRNIGEKGPENSEEVCESLIGLLVKLLSAEVKRVIG